MTQIQVSQIHSPPCFPQNLYQSSTVDPTTCLWRAWGVMGLGESAAHRAPLQELTCLCVQKTQTQRHTSQNLRRLLEGLGGPEGWRQTWKWEEEETEPDSISVPSNASHLELSPP